MRAQRAGTEVPFYPDDLIPQLQRTLALLAEIETRYEIERDYLESWSGPSEVKDQHLAELERHHRANRERLNTCLEGMRLIGRRLEPAAPRRTDH